jgi:hypothetical protein
MATTSSPIGNVFDRAACVTAWRFPNHAGMHLAIDADAIDADCQSGAGSLYATYHRHAFTGVGG